MLEILWNTSRDFFSRQNKAADFLKDVCCFEHTYPDLCLLLGIYTAVLALDRQTTAITGVPKHE